MNKTTLNSQKEKHSMLSLRRATFVGLAAHRLRNISIHALLAESDCYSLRHSAQGRYFYPRSPCGERHQPVTMHTWRKVFLSTLSLRRATPLTSGTKTIFTNFYPRSPCGERRCLIMLGGFAVDFYPRSPCGERLGTLRTVSVKKTFLSTLSLRRATRPATVHTWRKVFLSTLSLRRATPQANYPCVTPPKFLSTLSLRRATLATRKQDYLCGNFYPRSPCGERHGTPPYNLMIHQNFYPRSPCGERHRIRHNREKPRHFYPRSPCGERLFRRC